MENRQGGDMPPLDMPAADSASVPDLDWLGYSFALTVMQPWADLIVRGVKRWENRTWTTKTRGTLFIHSSGTGFDSKGLTKMVRCGILPASTTKADFTMGSIIGIVHHAGNYSVKNALKLIGDDEPWSQRMFISGPHCWRLKWPLRLVEPIPCKGKRGIWRCEEHVEHLLSCGRENPRVRMVMNGVLPPDYV